MQWRMRRPSMGSLGTVIMAMMTSSIALATIARAMAHDTVHVVPDVAARGSGTTVGRSSSGWSVIPGTDDAEGAACAGTRNPCILNGTLESVGACQKV